MDRCYESEKYIIYVTRLDIQINIGVSLGYSQVILKCKIATLEYLLVNKSTNPWCSLRTYSPRVLGNLSIDYRD